MKTNKKPSAKKTVKKAVKKAPTKKVTKKTAVKKLATKKATVSNKTLTAMLKTIEKAKKAKESSVVVYTTSREDHPNATSGGFGFQDLKPSLKEAYNKIICQFQSNFRTNLVNPSEQKVEWIVDL